MTHRMVKRVSQSRPTIEGAGVHLKRAFGFGESELYDPFLLLDDFRSDHPSQYRRGFPWHPHRGIETITYVLKGTVEHGDSLGNAGVIGPGDVQWMTAGNGILHKEMPKGDSEGHMHGFQLWANLPAAHKMMDPRYQELSTENIPQVTRENGTLIRILCGEIDGVTGPVRDIMIEPRYLDITIPSHGSTEIHTTETHTVFAYVIGGSGSFTSHGGSTALQHPIYKNGTLAVFDQGPSVFAAAGDLNFRFLLISGKPIKEPVAWYGPIVMNTEEELQTAFRELQLNTFIKVKKH